MLKINNSEWILHNRKANCLDYAALRNLHGGSVLWARQVTGYEHTLRLKIPSEREHSESAP